MVTDLAAYYAMVDERIKGLELIEVTVAGNPENPQLIAHVAEAFEDLGERDRALEWVQRAFDAGMSPSKFEDRPTLRDLVADPRFRQMANQSVDQS